MNQQVEVSATPNTGWEFVNWTEGTDVVSSDPTFTYEVTHDVHLVANFQKKSYNINVSVEGYGDVSGGGSYLYLDEVELLAIPNEHNQFVGWFVGEELVSEEEGFSFAADEDLEIVAKFERIIYEVTLEANPIEGGNVELS